LLRLASLSPSLCQTAGDGAEGPCRYRYNVPATSIRCMIQHDPSPQANAAGIPRDRTNAVPAVTNGRRGGRCIRPTYTGRGSSRDTRDDAEVPHPSQHHHQCPAQPAPAAASSTHKSDWDEPRSAPDRPRSLAPLPRRSPSSAPRRSPVSVSSSSSAPFSKRNGQFPISQAAPNLRATLANPETASPRSLLYSRVRHQLVQNNF
jgi:hypothetical protein